MGYTFFCSYSQSPIIQTCFIKICTYWCDMIERECHKISHWPAFMFRGFPVFECLTEISSVRGKPYIRDNKLAYTYIKKGLSCSSWHTLTSSYTSPSKKDTSDPTQRKDRKAGADVRPSMQAGAAPGRLPKQQQLDLHLYIGPVPATSPMPREQIIHRERALFLYFVNQPFPCQLEAQS